MGSIDVTWDTVNKGSDVILSNANLTAKVPNYNNTVRATHGKSHGKWYWEITVSVYNWLLIGIVNRDAVLTSSNSSTQNARYYWENGKKLPENVLYGENFVIGDVISVLLDLENGTLEFWKNGVSQWVSHTNIKTMGEIFPAVSAPQSAVTESTVTANFGATPFKYKVPLGFLPYQTQEKVLVLSNGVYWECSNIGWERVTNSSPTEQDYINHGMDDISIIPESAWKELSGDVQVCYWTNDLYKPEASFNIETEPFTLAEEFDDQTIKIIEYTENPEQEDSIITLETEPFTFYDEVGDSFDVLYYTDDPDKTESELEIKHNYSPLDELDGDFELVTWTMEEEAEVREELKPIFKEKIEDGDLYGVTVDLSKGIVNIE
ncbi:SPRY domain-containing protein [Paenibacillus thiaminolyticus]|nr:SPRY domain-containing protein [Paenibacillus thiaminolyticus]